MDWTLVHAPARVGIRPVVLLTAGLWLTVYLFFTARSYFIEPNFLPMALARLINCTFGALLSGGLYLLLRSQAKRPFVVLLAGGLLASLVAALVYAVIAASVYGSIGATPIELGPTPVRFITTVLERTQASPWVFLAWCCGFFAMDYNERLRANELSMVELQALAADAQNRMLRYQIQPHFLFNTLSAVSTLILRNENERAERMVMRLSRFLRYSLARSPEDCVTLHEEAEAQEQYLAIEQERFGDRLRFVRSIQPEAEHMLAPSMIIQPLIENAVKHAVAPTDRPVTVTLSAHVERGRLVIAVSDDGAGAGPATIVDAPGLGVGLENVRRRLEVTYDGRAEFSSGPRPQGGYLAVMRLPAEAA